MDNMTSFSIIVPIYNTKKNYLIESLNSLISLDYDNYEIILVDDGSNEETKKILKDFRKSAKNITIIEQNNSGQYVSRINGVKKAKNQYIIFVDSDDLLSKDALKKIDFILSSNKYDVVMYYTCRFINSITNIEYITGKYFEKGEINKKDVISELLEFHINSVCTKCVKKEVFNSIDNNIRCDYRYGEDLFLSTNIILNAVSFYFLDDNIYFYRINEEQRDYYDKTRIKDINYSIHTYNEIFQKRNCYDGLINVYKKSAIKQIIYVAFSICYNNKNNINECLNDLCEQDIFIIISNIKEKTNFVYELLFYFLQNKMYFFIKICSKIYHLYSYKLSK